MSKSIINPSMTNKELLTELLSRLDYIEGNIPNGEMSVLLNHMEVMMERQEKMYDDLSEMKRLLLNPENGVVVRVNKNTEFRVENQQRENQYNKLIEEHNELMKFKSNIIKILWIILSSIIGTLVMLWSKIN